MTHRNTMLYVYLYVTYRTISLSFSFFFILKLLNVIEWRCLTLWELCVREGVYGFGIWIRVLNVTPSTKRHFCGHRGSPVITSCNTRAKAQNAAEQSNNAHITPFMSND
eukprot:Rmarinus@m.19831